MSSPSPPEVPPSFNIAPLVGPIFFGGIFNCILFGILVVQCYIYYLTCKADRPMTKAFVAFVFAAEIAQSGMIIRDLFRIFGTGTGSCDLQVLTSVGLSWFTVPFLAAFISGLVQLFYIWRIHVLGHPLWCVSITLLVAAAQAVAGMVTGIRSYYVKDLANMPKTILTSAEVWVACSATCDVMISLSMIYILSRGRTGFRETDDIISRLIRVTMETGLLTSTMAVAELIIYKTTPGTVYYVAGAYCLTKVYANALLALMNSRVRMSTPRNPGTDTQEMHSIKVVNISSGSSRNAFKPTGLDFKLPPGFVGRESEGDVDSQIDHIESES